MNMMSITALVADYFEREEGLKNYEPIAVIPNGTDEYLYRVLGKYIGGCSFQKKNPYAVWMSFNTSTDAMNNGHYNLNIEDAYELFTTGDIDRSPVSKERAIELATKFKDYIEEWKDDRDVTYDLFKNDLDMSDKEIDFFGIKKPKRYKKVQVETTLTFNVIMEMDEDEDSIDNLDDYAASYIQDTGVSYYNINTKVVRENISPEEAKRSYEDCYGYEDID